MSLRRGFKAGAERIATEVRSELGLDPTTRLDPRALSEHLGIPVFGIRDIAHLAQEPAVGGHFLAMDRESFSAMTVIVDGRRLIVHNEGHAPTRQASNLTHELSHCLLEHPPGPAIGAGGCRVWQNMIEEEATWLAGVLLVPRDGALALARAHMSPAAIAVHYGVSEELCAWRINQTGVTLQLRRSARWRQRQGFR